MGTGVGNKESGLWKKRGCMSSRVGEEIKDFLAIGKINGGIKVRDGCSQWKLG
jgi:hypothetical protein